LVISIGKVSSGTAFNVIPNNSYLEGTIRTFSETSRKKVHEEIYNLCQSIAIANRCTAAVDIVPGYPVTVNNEQVTNFVRNIVIKLFGEENYTQIPPVTGAEDFSFVLQKYPGTFIFLGASAGDPLTAAPGHSEKAIFSEDPMLRGIMLHCAVALEVLSVHSAKL